MLHARSMIVAAALIAVGASFSMLFAAVPGTGPATTTAATKVGSVSGKVVDKDGKPAVGAAIRYNPVVATATGAAPATAAAPGGGAGAGGGRGGRGGRGGGRGGLGNAVTDDKGAFVMADVPVGQVNITATLTPTDGSTRQRGTTSAPVTVKEKEETKIADAIKLADAPVGGGRGGAVPPATTATASRPAGM